ncbi:MAG: hypothetical protein D6704_10435 [Nitrospirae bacterium]|nr:MAG: hypothetical protein D6704_10435 [Nitrospirota bacterium]
MRPIHWIGGIGLLAASLVSEGCVSPLAMHRAVIEYDRTVSRIETELLLLNIARIRHHLPIHFTSVSSIAATFDFRMNTGLTGRFSESPSTDSLTLTLGTSAAESPTVSIVPIKGEEFTERLLTPITEDIVLFLAHQGIDPGLLFRLLGRGIFVEQGSTRTFYLNMPHRAAEYREFRRRILHLSSLYLARQLFIGPLQFVQNAKRVTGRIAITNYDPNWLPNGERQALHDYAQQFPLNHVLIDIRSGYPGGDYPLFGHLKLRSFKAILGFLGRGIQEEPEFHVDPDPRSGPVLANPVKTLNIRESREPPPGDTIIAVYEQGYWYFLEPHMDTTGWEARWQFEAFDVLYQLFHLTVTEVARTSVLPITIAK